MTKSVKLKNDTFWNGEICSTLNKGTDNVCIKWANGLMICFAKVSVTANFNISAGSMYNAQLNNVLTFPTAFKYVPMVSITTASTSDYVFASAYATVCDKTKISQVNLLRPTQSSGTTVLNIIAIGFWK